MKVDKGTQLFFTKELRPLIRPLIYTCELCGANALDYLTQLQENADQVATHPECWMPWNYRDMLNATPAAA